MSMNAVLAFTALLSATEAFVTPIHVRPMIAGVSTAPRVSTASTKMNMSGPLDRTRFFQTVAGGVGALLVQEFTPEAAVAGDGPAVNYDQVKADILAVMNKDPNRGPTLVRLAWHASGTYDRISKNGGSIGGTIRFQDELSHGANAGLYTAVEWLEPLKKKYPAISYGDLYTLGGVVAIEKMGGPKIKWRAGRKDQGVEAVTPDGRLPAADLGNPMKTAQGLRDVFYRMGFDDREIVALSGAHALGRCHANYSGYEGPWTPTPTLFAGSTYFKLLKAVKWTPKEWKGPFQYEDPSGSLMMLPSDIVLLQDKKFASYVDKYAADDALFFKDFSAAFSKLLELGTSNLEEVTLA